MQHTHRSFCLKGLSLVVTLGSLFAGSGLASTIASGQVNFSGNATVTSSAVNFFGGPMDTTPGVVNVGQPDTGGFAGFSGGTVKNLGSFPLVDFLTLATTSGPVFIDLQGFNPGTGTIAGCVDVVGAVCTPGNSPFTLTQNQGLVNITLSVYGIAYTGSSATGSDPTLGLFTSQTPGTISQVLNAAASSSGFADSYSATFTSASPTTTPEPGSFLALGTGLLLLSTGVYRRKRRT